MTKRANRTLAFLATMMLLVLLLVALVVIPAAVYADQEDQPIAFAVYDAETDTLSFHKQLTVPEVGTTFTGSDGVTRTATAVYEGIESEGYAAGWKTIDDAGNKPGFIMLVDEITPSSVSGWFSGQSRITSLDLKNLNTINVKSMASMFSGCSSLRSLDVSMLRTDNVTDMKAMFLNCMSLTSLDLSGFNTSNVKYLNTMFRGCSSITEFDLRSFDTSSVIQMPMMFEGCSSVVAIDLSSFDVTSVTAGFTGLFDNCTSLTTIYAGEKWIPAHTTSPNPCFKNCMNLVGAAGTTVDPDDPHRFWPCYLIIDGGPERPGYLSTHKKSLGVAKVTGLEMPWVLATDKTGPTPTLMDGDKILELGVDYATTFTPRSDTYKHNAVLMMTGIGDYEGFIKKEFGTLYILTRDPSDTQARYIKTTAQKEEETAINAPIVLKSNSPIAAFLRFMLNGKEVGPEHYTLKEGSTIVELHEDFLDSLKPGTYVATIESADGSVAAELTIEAEEGYVDPDPGNNPYAPDEPENPDDPNPVTPDDPTPVMPDDPDDPKGDDPKGDDPVNPGPTNPNDPNAGDEPGAGDNTQTGSAGPGTSGDQSGSDAKPGTPGAPGAPTYSILEAASHAYVRNSGQELVVRADGALEKLTALLVDGNELKTPDHYTVVSGSTVATLNPEYLDTLPAGEHTLTFRYNDGEVDTTFTVNEPSEGDGTGDGGSGDGDGNGSSITQVDVTTGNGNGTGATSTNRGGTQSGTGGSARPGTGDSSALALWALLMLAGALGAGVAHRARRRA